MAELLPVKSMNSEAVNYLKSRRKINFLMVAANVAVTLLIAVTGGDLYNVNEMFGHGAMYAPAVIQGGEFYRLFTCMFLHFGWEHLFYNMMLLWFAGDMLEERAGAVRYLLIYVIGGVLGNVLSLAVGIDREVVSAGASGAVFAVIGALIWIVVRNKGRAEGIDNRGICMMALLSLAQGFMDSGVDNYAHLGGFIGGFLLAAILRTGSAPRRKNS